MLRGVVVDETPSEAGTLTMKKHLLSFKLSHYIKADCLQLLLIFEYIVTVIQALSVYTE